MVRAGSPTLRPTLTVNGPFTVDEGSVGTLSATAKQPATKAWMQLFTEPQYDGHYVVVDYDDYVLDDYNQLVAVRRCRSATTSGSRSWRWFAPLFCNAQAVADDVYDQSDVPYRADAGRSRRSPSAIPTSR